MRKAWIYTNIKNDFIFYVLISNITKAGIFFKRLDDDDLVISEGFLPHTSISKVQFK